MVVFLFMCSRAWLSPPYTAFYKNHLIFDISSQCPIQESAMIYAGQFTDLHYIQLGA